MCVCVISIHTPSRFFELLRQLCCRSTSHFFAPPVTTGCYPNNIKRCYQFFRSIFPYLFIHSTKLLCLYVVIHKILPSSYFKKVLYYPIGDKTKSFQSRKKELLASSLASQTNPTISQRNPFFVFLRSAHRDATILRSIIDVIDRRTRRAVGRGQHGASRPKQNGIRPIRCLEWRPCTADVISEFPNSRFSYYVNYGSFRIAGEENGKQKNILICNPRQWFCQVCCFRGRPSQGFLASDCCIVVRRLLCTSDIFLFSLSLYLSCSITKQIQWQKTKILSILSILSKQPSIS